MIYETPNGVAVVRDCYIIAISDAGDGRSLLHLASGGDLVVNGSAPELSKSHDERISLRCARPLTATEQLLIRLTGWVQRISERIRRKT